MMSDAELRALLRLSCVPHLGDVQLGRLLQRYGQASPLLDVPAHLLGPWGFERDSTVTRRRVDAALRTIDELQLAVWSLLDADYPAALRQLEDPPVLLFARGDTRVLQRTGVAVVGTRSPTDYGISVARMLAFGLAEAGIVIWSGAARGIDACAHLAALDAGGATVAVLGCGIDVVYPREHTRLYEDIAERGALLTEFLPGAPPLAHHFPRRNRILARMPKKVLIVEARVDGGALITAEQAGHYDDVLAVPGPIGRATSHGTNRLIQDGAALVMEVADVLEALGGPLNASAGRSRPSAKKRWTRVGLLKLDARPVQQPALGEERLPVQRDDGRQGAIDIASLPPELARVSALLEQHDTIHIDDLAAAAGMRAPALLGVLVRLINLGIAEDCGGKQFKRAVRTRRPAA